MLLELSVDTNGQSKSICSISDDKRQTISLWRMQDQTCKGSEISAADIVLDYFMDLEHELG